MSKLADFRKQYPQYEDMSDAALLDALHSRYYNDIPKDEFITKMGGPAPSDSSFVGGALQRGYGNIVQGLGRIVEEAPEILAGTLENALTIGKAAVAPGFGSPRDYMLGREGAIQAAAKEVAPTFKEAVSPVTGAVQRYGKETAEAAGPGQYGAALDVEGPESLGDVGRYVGEFAPAVGETLLESAIPTAAGLATGILTRNPRAAGAVLLAGSVPATYEEIRDTQARTGAENIGKAVAATGASSALDFLFGSGAAVRKLGLEAAKQSLLKAGLRTGAEEGLTEVAQTAIERTGGGADITSPEALKELAESGLVGFFGGAVTGPVAEGANRVLTKKVEQAAAGIKPLGSFEVNIPDPKDPTQIKREQLDVLTQPDKNGIVTVRRADGSLRQIELKSLEEMQVPTEGIGAFRPSDAFKRENIQSRILEAFGETQLDANASRFAENLSLKLANDLALGKPDAVADYIAEQEARLGKKKTLSDKAQAQLQALQSAKSVLNDYRAEYAQSIAEPGVQVGTEAPAPTDTIADILARNAEQQAKDAQLRGELLAQVMEDTSIINKNEAFADLVAQNGLEAVSSREAKLLRAAVRVESEFESTAAKEEERRARQEQIARMDIIEKVLTDPSVKDRIAKINTELKRRNFAPITPDEMETVYGREAALDVFGPMGEFERTKYGPEGEAGLRQRTIDEVLSDPNITDKFSAFTARVADLDLAPVTEEEAAALEQASTVSLEPSRERVDVGRVEAGNLPYSGWRQYEPQMLREAPDRETLVQMVLEDPRITDKYRAYSIIADELGFAPLTQEQMTALEEASGGVSGLEDQIRGERRPATQPTLAAEPEAELPAQELTPPGPQVIGELTGEETQQLRRQRRRQRVEDRRARKQARKQAAEQAEQEALAAKAAQENVDLAALEQQEDLPPEPVMEGPAEDVEAAPEVVAPREPQIEDEIESTPQKPKEGTVALIASLQNKLRPFLSAVQRKINYKYQDAVDYARQLASAFNMTSLPNDLDVARRFELFESRRSGNQMRIFRTHIDPMLDLIKKLDLEPQDIAMYLWARSAKDRNALVRARNLDRPVDGSGLTDAEAEAYLTEFKLRGLEPKLKQVAKLHDQLVDYMLKMRVDSGLMTKDEAKSLRAEQPFYTPLKGFALDGDMQVEGDDNPHTDDAIQKARSKLGNTRISEFMKVEGRKSMPFNPLFNLMADAMTLVQRVEINKVGKTFLNALLTDPKSSDVAKVYDAKERVTETYLNPVTKQYETRSVPIWQVANKNPKKFLIVKDAGVPYYIEFQDTDGGNAMQRAFNNMRPTELEWYLSAPVGFANAVKSLMTRYNPAYLLGPAPLRDYSDAVATAYAMQTKKGSPAFGKKLGSKVKDYVLAPDMVEAVTRYIAGAEPRNDKQAGLMLLLDQMIEDGGAVAHAMVKDAETFATDAQQDLKLFARMKKKDPTAYAQKGITALGNVLDATSQAIDLQGRFATYRAALELGIDRDGAASLALDSSLNLTRRGEWARALDTLFFFASPSIESARKFLKMGLTTRNGAKIMGYLVALGAIETIWNNMWSGDDDEDGRKNYKDINPILRQTRLVFVTGPGADDYVSIPIGFMLAYPKYAGSIIAEAGLGLISNENAGVMLTDASYKLTAGLASVLSPVKVSGLDSPSIFPFPGNIIAGLMLNKNFFGGPIYRDTLDPNVVKSDMGRETTGRVWKWVAQSLNNLTRDEGETKGFDHQPEKYRYIVEQFGGGAYRVVKDTVNVADMISKGEEVAAKDIPVVRQFVGKGSEFVPFNQYKQNIRNMETINKRVEDASDEELARIEAEFPIETDSEVADAYEEAKSELARLRKDYADAKKEAIDAEERKALSDSYSEDTAEVYKQFNRIYNERKKALK